MNKITALTILVFAFLLVSVSAAQRRPQSPPKVPGRQQTKPLPEEMTLLRDLRKEVKGRLFLEQVQKQHPNLDPEDVKRQFDIRLDNKFKDQTMNDLLALFRQMNERIAEFPVLAYDYSFSTMKDICTGVTDTGEDSGLPCVTDSQAIDASKAVAAIVFNDAITESGGQWTLVTHALTSTDTSFGELCEGEPFRNEPSTNIKGTGFLVADDVIATAGHVIDRDDFLEAVVFVFDYVTESYGKAKTNFDSTEVYKGEEIMAHRIGDADWALIRLERPVVGRSPLKCRAEGKVEAGAPVYMLGYPDGMPQKYSGVAQVEWNEACCYFLAKLDARPGNSGSPVINADLGIVEGIFVHDKPAYELVCDCLRTALDDETGGSPGADVVRTTEFAGFLQNPQSVLVQCRLATGRIASVTVGNDTTPHCLMANTSELVPWSDLGFYLTVNMECELRYDPEPGSIWEIVEPGEGHLKMQKVCFP